MLFHRQKANMISADEALPGHDVEALPMPLNHEVLGTPIKPPFPDGMQQIVVGMGCFWGAERVFWEAPGVYTTAVGYAGGYTRNPTYNDVGTQYRSAIYWFDEEQRQAAESSAAVFRERLAGAGYGEIATEIAAAGD